MLAASLLFALRLCFIREMPRLAIATAVIWIYVLVAGWNPPAVRAAGAFTLYALGRYFYRPGRIMNLLATVGIIYLACDPSELFEAGFQLSFLSVAAIAVLAAPLLERTSRRIRTAVVHVGDVRGDARLEPRAAQFRLELRLFAEALHYYLRLPERWLLTAMAWGLRACLFAFDMAVVSTVMQVGLALPMAIYFHRISWSGFSANVVIVPLLSLIVPVGFVAIFSGWSLAAQRGGRAAASLREDSGLACPLGTGLARSGPAGVAGAGVCGGADRSGIHDAALANMAVERAGGVRRAIRSSCPAPVSAPGTRRIAGAYGHRCRTRR